MKSRRSAKPKAKQNRARDIERTLPPRTSQQQPNDLDALKFLDGLVSLAPVNRQQHIAAQNAIAQLTRALQRLDAFMIAKSADKQDKEKPDEQPDKGKD